ncbi:hypothetical protein A11M_0101040 [Xanthomonas vasicola pv. vasculorum NCPPB 895]|nr:hypothetical protein A11M_0101040 [Xanthomonas vasicola pv. vasculorum NCPPB 895]
MVVGRRLVQRFGARFGHAGVAQLQMAQGFAHEARLLAVAFHQRYLQLRAGDRQGDAGQAGAGAQVGQSAAGDVGLHGQRIEQMAGNHLARVAHGGEVVGLVPAHQQGQVAQQRRGEGRIQGLGLQAAFERGRDIGGKCGIVHGAIIAAGLAGMRVPMKAVRRGMAWLPRPLVHLPRDARTSSDRSCMNRSAGGLH